MPRANRRPAAPRTLGDVGEFAWLARLGRELAAPSRGVALGVGDDAALVRLAPGDELAVSTDAAIEATHFDLRVDDARRVGRASLAAALSDLAAMGARPLACTLSLAAPSSFPLAVLDRVVRGHAREARERGAPLIGGNLARAGELALHTTALGAVRRGCALQRDAARSGDRLFVTGELGGAALARRRAEKLGRPNRFVPPDRLAAGRALARLAASGARIACIDLSDGLVSDLPHLLGPLGGPARLGAEVDFAALPRARGFDARCREVGLDPARALGAGGEDYELLFTLGASRASATALARRLGCRVTEIGLITATSGVRGLPREARPFRHFRAG